MSVTGFLVNNTVQKYDYESLENYNTPDFSTSSTYQVGDYVMYQGKLYKCTTAITTSGAWDSTKWILAILSDDVADLKNAISHGTGLTTEAKEALLACFRHVAWIDADGQEYYDALEDALYPPVELVSISAVYTQSGTVYNTDNLDSLKFDLVVTAHYEDSTTAIVTNYTLSGTLTVGTSTITVSYGGKTTTFNVIVTEYTVPPLYNWDLTQSLTDTEQGVVVDTNGTFAEGTGLSFTADNKYADFGTYELDRTYELTIEALNRSNTTSYRRFLMTYKNNNTSVYGNGLVFSTSKGGVEFYTGSWQTAILQTSNIADLDGKWSIYTGMDGKWKVYHNGVYIGQSTTAIAKNSDHTNMYVGSSAGDYTRVKITSFKVYEGEVIN